MNNPSKDEPFQARAARAIKDVLTLNAIVADFKIEGDARYADFDWKGAPYTVAVFAAEINMREGPNLYECYLREEFSSEDAYIRSFCSRLDRFLRQGEWG